jgi:hypothetical protein
MPRQSHSLLAAALLGAGLFTITAICPASTHAASSTIVITDPNAIVLGHTLTEWTAEYIRWAFAKPATGQPPGTTSAFNDPDGTYAETYNHGPMFFVTGGAPSMPSRTLNVPHGTLILFPISTLEDTEGPSIPPSIPGFVPAGVDPPKFFRRGRQAQRRPSVFYRAVQPSEARYDVVPVWHRRILGDYRGSQPRPA